MADALQVNELIVAPIIAIPLLIVILVFMFILSSINRHRFGNSSNRLPENEESFDITIEMTDESKSSADENENNEQTAKKPPEDDG